MPRILVHKYDESRLKEIYWACEEAYEAGYNECREVMEEIARNAIMLRKKLEVETLKSQCDKIAQLGEMLKMAYYQKIGTDTPHGLDCCDDYKDWLKSLQIPNGGA